MTARKEAVSAAVTKEAVDPCRVPPQPAPAPGKKIDATDRDASAPKTGAVSQREAVEAGVREAIARERDDRRRALSRVPHFALEARHLEQCRLLPDREELLRRLPQHAIAAEVGVAFGDFTALILREAAPAKLHLIDAWSTDRYRSGLDRIREANASALKRQKIQIHQGLSTDRLAEFDDNYFDWIYIDTDHTYDTTLAELRLASRVVRPSGRIAGHDHCTGNVVKPFPYGVIQAVAQFCVEDGWGYEYLTSEPHGHASFCLLKL